MAEEDERVVRVPVPVGESGKNIAALIDYQSRMEGTQITGYPKGLAQTLMKLGFVPGSKEDLPGSADDFAEALQSDNPVLLRENIKGQQVPARWYEYVEDRQDVVSGVLGDYLLGPLFNIIGGFAHGWKKNKKDAEEFIQKINHDYPIDTEWVRDYFLHLGEHENPRDHTSRMISYRARWNETERRWERVDEDAVVMEGTYPIPNWYPFGVGLNPVDLIRRTEIRHEFERPNNSAGSSVNVNGYWNRNND